MTKTKCIILDIETGPLPVSHREFMRPSANSVKVGNIKDPAKIAAKIAEAEADFEAGSDAALDALSGRVLLVGLLVEGELVQIHDADEAELLRRTWDLLDSNNPDRIIGHNVIGFDARFLMRRSLVLGVSIPDRLFDDLHRFQPDVWTDTMTMWGLGDRQARVSLHNLCGAMGLATPKDGPICGANFGAMWQTDRAACLAYNAADLDATAQVYCLLSAGAA